MFKYTTCYCLRHCCCPVNFTIYHNCSARLSVHSQGFKRSSQKGFICTMEIIIMYSAILLLILIILKSSVNTTLHPV